VWEHRLGKGTILACGFGLRYQLGSPNSWEPTENARLLVANAVRYLARGLKSIRVALLGDDLQTAVRARAVALDARRG
jgi:hypothetical protein